MPIKLIKNKVIVNIQNDNIPLGAEIISINNKTLKDIIPNFYKYYTTDGINISGKSIGLNYSFSKYYRFFYGSQNSFDITYKTHKTDNIEHTIMQSIGYANYYKNVKNRYSKPFDEPNYNDWEENEIYSYKSIDKETGILTINNFGLGNEKSVSHLRYVQFLDSTFSKIKNDSIKNLILDVRYNGGGTDPNDLVTYSYLSQRTFSENKQAWISFNKIPYLKYIESSIPSFLRPLGVGKYNRKLKQEFPIQENEKYYQNSSSSDHKIRVPNEKAFNGKIFLLISPRTASAGSLFASMVAGNMNTTVIGEETMGGYYGHNGHTPMSYVLPKSKIVINFSIVNLEQDVPKKENQIYNRGILPDYRVTQTYDDYLNQMDTQMKFVLDLIKSGKK